MLFNWYHITQATNISNRVVIILTLQQCVQCCYGNISRWCASWLAIWLSAPSIINIKINYAKFGWKNVTLLPGVLTLKVTGFHFTSYCLIVVTWHELQLNIHCCYQNGSLLNKIISWQKNYKNTFKQTISISITIKGSGLSTVGRNFWK